jgi:signal transduction histidine kinase
MAQVTQAPETERVLQALRSSLDQETVRMANLRAPALIPMHAELPNLPLPPRGVGIKSILGVLLVERRDGRTVSALEADDLALFAGQIAHILLVRDMYVLLHACLEQDDDPMLIVNDEFQIVAASYTAPEYFALPESAPWQSLKDLPQNKWLLDQLLQAKRVPRLDRSHESPKDGEMRHHEVVCELLTVSAGTASGRVVHVRDHNMDTILRVMEAFSIFAQADAVPVAARDPLVTAYRSVLEAAKILGFSSGRLYLISNSRPDLLKCEECFGTDEDIERHCREGRIVLPRAENEASEAWIALETQKPEAFCFQQNGENLSTQTMQLQGVRYRVVLRPALEDLLKKKVGSFWVDVPLFAGDKPLGKLTLECKEESLTRITLGVLGGLGKVYSALLEGILRKAEQAERHDRELELRAEKRALDEALRQAGHNFTGKLATYRDLYTRYKKLEASKPELEPIMAPLNKRLLNTTAHLSELVKRIDEVYRRIDPKPDRLDLAGALREHFAGANLGGVRVEVLCKIDPFTVCVDRTLLLEAINELLTNSRVMAAPGVAAEVTMELEYVKYTHGEMARLIYRDNGPGVPTELKHHIFDQFFSFRPRPEQVPGTGLGLNFVQRVIEAHNGTIRETGQRDKGAEFVVEIPRDCQSA